MDAVPRNDINLDAEDHRCQEGGKTDLFELAHQGTLFLDEIGDISPKIQSRLLRVLQEKEILRVGGTKNMPVNVRVVAATNKDLAEMVKHGSFREDLYYRLNKLYVQIPPLRERREDIELLFKHFLIQKNGFDLKLMDDARSILVGYEWPGNVREFENNVEYILAIREQEPPTTFIQQSFSPPVPQTPWRAGRWGVPMKLQAPPRTRPRQ